MTKISAFIICKNEEARIETALKSLVSFCDEIVVVDSGSTDSTKEIVAQYTDKIFDFVWVDDFSAARNFALGKCHGEWILFVDADDELSEDAQRSLKKMAEGASEDVAGFFVNYEYGPDKFQFVPRLWRARFHLKFHMPVHEYLEIPEELRNRFVVHSEVVILHHKDASENMVSMERNIRILQKALLRQDGADENFHLNFFLAREFFNIGEYAKAIAILDDLLKKKSSGDRSFVYNVYLHLGFCHEKLGEFEEALNCFKKAFECDQRFVEPLVHAADIWLYKLNKLAEAQQLYERSLQIPLPQTTFPIQRSFYHQYPNDQLHKIHQLNKPIALICGYYGNMNIGDELMLQSIIQHLPDYRIIVASSKPEITTKLHKVESVPIKHQYFDHVLQQAKLVVIGGGTLFHDQGLAENQNVPYYCGIIAKAAELNKDVVVLGVGVDSIQMEPNRTLIAQTFPLCKNIFVRDENSRKRLTGCGVKAELIDVIPDLIFGLEMKNREKIISGKQKPLIGINLCPPIKNGPQRYMENIEQYLLLFMDSHRSDYDFIFIPGHQNDLQYLAYFEQKLKMKLKVFQPDVGSGSAYFDSFYETITECDFFIASRYHLLLLGLLLQKPTFSISYSEKTDSLLDEFSAQLRPFTGQISTKHRVIPLDELKKLQNQLKDIFQRLLH